MIGRDLFKYLLSALLMIGLMFGESTTLANTNGNNATGNVLPNESYNAMNGQLSPFQIESL
ncbi:hypothetical protein ACFOZY_07780 [Chungangia koreensis]|uniref:Uncharacterized protein n=1 Tax=Chungangia koreensis TaxID=752657 RepID=A0ABV8X5I9_9LACT